MNKTIGFLTVLLITSSLSADLTKAGPELTFNDQDSEDYGFYLGLNGFSDNTPSIVLTDLFWAKKCTTNGNGFMKFGKKEAVGEEYGKMLYYSTQNMNNAYSERIKEIHKQYCN